MSKRTVQGTIVFVVLILVVIGYYSYLVNRDKQTTNDKKISTVQNVLLTDLEKNYPPTPKEVVKFYNDIMKCFYNEETTEQEIEELAMKARELYDDELLENNDWGSNIISLETEISDFKGSNKRITSISVASSTNVDYYSTDGFDFARVRSSYNVVQDKSTTTINQVYLLRKDVNNHWKIYGWELAENLEENT